MVECMPKRCLTYCLVNVRVGGRSVPFVPRRNYTKGEILLAFMGIFDTFEVSEGFGSLTISAPERVEMWSSLS